jgi:integrase
MKWVKVKPGLFRREVAKGQFEYKYRVAQKDGVGADVDTIRKQNDRGEPFRTQREAEAHRKAYIAEIMGRTERSVNIPDLHTLQEIFNDYEEKRGVTLAPNSLSKHKGDMKNHIAPYFRRRRIESITPGEITNFVTGLRAKQAYATTRSVLATMAKVWKYSYEVGIISRDTYVELFVDNITKIRVPKLDKDKQAKKSPEVYSHEQIERFRMRAKQEGDVFDILILLCYYGGVRLSEALGLMWSDVNLDNGYITVRRQVAYNKNTHITYIGPTKSRVNRIFLVPPPLLTALADWKKEQEACRKKLGKGYKANEELENHVDGSITKGGDFVLRNEVGTLLTRSKANHFRERVQKDLGEHFYFHGLRHTVVSRLAGAGVPIKNISDFIGHSDTRTTEQFYLGIDELGQQKLAEAIQNL